MEIITTIIVFQITILIIIAPIAIIISLINTTATNNRQQQPPQNQIIQPIQQSQIIEKQELPYILKNKILTNREIEFYKALKNITDKYNLIIFSKMRIADIVDVKPYTKNHRGWFQRISQKHIDFILCNQELKPKILIELDDSTHDTSERIERDNFVNSIFSNSGIRLLRFRNWTIDQVENDIKICLFGFKKENPLQTAVLSGKQGM